ncbi:uncharacterized protein LOC124888508 [Capsicum annuum]|uniref:uncharacterized protein LOC124888508 n=1 Tax=Capsicum annuum TaxID=4072 RepID=UPI001FB12567|nr:uncharacterized protein LOC124888508 [Capsicum annuum]XP_047254969.1 uncharacterized protein LOC124888508 [Capsicum annuum]XP_047254970.1 uncharacterized protein LOC124888508 [Capsicum annuum]
MDDDKDEESKISYIMSLYFNFLPFRYRGSFILDPYSPCQFSRQFGFYQGLSGILENDIHNASLDEGLKFHQICVFHGSMSKDTFPRAISNMQRYLSIPYKSWWDKVHGNLLEVNLQSLLNGVGPIIDTPKEHIEEVPIMVKPPVLKSKVVILYKVKGPPHTETQKEELPTLTQQAFNKRPSQDESDSSYEDHCWKKVKPYLTKQGDSKSHIEILASSSKTPPAIKKPVNVQVLEDPHQSKPQNGSDYLVSPDSRELLLSSKEVTSNPCSKVKANVELNFPQKPQ